MSFRESLYIFIAVECRYDCLKKNALNVDFLQCTAHPVVIVDKYTEVTAFIAKYLQLFFPTLIDFIWFIYSG